MKVIPRLDSVRLISESSLEDDAILRWAGGRPRISWGSNYQHGGSLDATVVFDGAASTGRANVCTAPDPPRRTVRLPAIGQRVKSVGGFEGIVDGLIIWGSGQEIAVRFPDVPSPVRYGPTQVEPVGDDPRWIEVELPGEES